MLVVYSLAAQVAAQTVSAPVESSPRALYVPAAHAVHTLELTYSLTAHAKAVQVEAVPGVEPAAIQVPAAHAWQLLAVLAVVYSLALQVAAQVVTVSLLSPRALYVLPAQATQADPSPCSSTAQPATQVDAVPGVEPAGKYVFAAHAMQPSLSVLLVYSLAAQVAAQAVSAPVGSSPRALYVLPAHAVHTLELTYSLTAQVAAQVDAVPGVEPAEMYVPAAHAMQP